MKYTIIIKNEIPLSQNARSHRRTGSLITLFEEYKTLLQNEFIAQNAAFTTRETENLYGKVIYIHKRNDTHFLVRDADNISKPLWDALNEYVYDDDRQIRHRAASKIESTANEINEISFGNMKDADFDTLCAFLDSSNLDDQFLYVEIGEFNYKMVKLGE